MAPLALEYESFLCIPGAESSTGRPRHGFRDRRAQVKKMNTNGRSRHGFRARRTHLKKLKTSEGRIPTGSAAPVGDAGRGTGTVVAWGAKDTFYRPELSPCTFKPCY